MAWRERSFWVAAASVAYVVFAAIRSSESPTALALLALPLVLALVWRASAPPLRAEDRVEPGARAAFRACMTGAAIFLAARVAPARPAFDALSNAGAALSSMAGLVAIARIRPLGGLSVPPPSSRSLDAAAFASMLWTIAVGLPAARALDLTSREGVSQALLDYATVAASVGSLGLGIVATARARATRRLELGASERATAALVVLMTALCVSVLAGFAQVFAPERVLPVAAMLASIGMAWTATAREAVTVSRALRTFLALFAIEAPIALAFVYAGHSWPERAGAIAFGGVVAASIATLAMPAVSRWLAPSAARWIPALDAATRAAMNPDPDVALEAALGELAPFAAPRPRRADASGDTPLPAHAAFVTAALYRLSPAEMVTIDRAGYVHTTRAEAPERLLSLGENEPEGLVRSAVLRAAAVRRPDIRSLIVWLAERRVATAAVVRDDTGPIGVLTLPDQGRGPTMTHEEARAIRALADRLGAVLGVSSSLSRSRAREVSERARSAALEARVNVLEKQVARDENRLVAQAEAKARPAREAAYSPAARSATEQLERLATAGKPITLLTAAGVDAASWAALAHLASPNRRGELVVVGGASDAMHDLDVWRDKASSPLDLARSGTLVLLDAHVIPLDVQRYVAAALRGAGGLVVVVPATVDSLVADGRMDEALADKIGDRVVVLPPLAARSEDLQAIALAKLGAIGARLGKKALGIDARAQAALGEHTWPGNEVELDAVLLRAALHAEGDVIHEGDLAGTGIFTGEAPRATSDAPPPKRAPKKRAPKPR